MSRHSKIYKIIHSVRFGNKIIAFKRVIQCIFCMQELPKTVQEMASARKNKSYQKRIR